MNGKSGGSTTDQGAFEPTEEERDGGPAAPDSGKPSTGDRGGESSSDGPEAIDLDSAHDRAS